MKLTVLENFRIGIAAFWYFFSPLFVCSVCLYSVFVGDVSGAEVVSFFVGLIVIWLVSLAFVTFGLTAVFVFGDLLIAAAVVYFRRVISTWS